MESKKEVQYARSIACSSRNTHQQWTLNLFLVLINLWFVPEFFFFL